MSLLTLLTHSRNIIAASCLVLLQFAAADCAIAQPSDTLHTPGDPWNMEQCIHYALANNIQVRQAELQRHISKNNVTQSEANLLPTLNGFASQDYNYGLTINPFTNTFANNEVTDDQFAITSTVTLFGGFQSINTVRQNRLNYRASEYDLDVSKNNIALATAQDFLQILLNSELLDEAKEQQGISAQQVDRTSKLFQAGSVAKSNLLDMQSQEAADEVNVVNAESQLNISYLALAQALNLDSVQNFKIVKPDIEIPGNIQPDNPDIVYTKALSTQPDVQSSELKWESAERGVALSKGALFPKLQFSGSIGTGYSTANTEVTGTSVVGVDTIFTNQPGFYGLYPIEGYTTKLVPFIKQLSNNINKSFGFRLNIPIFNGLQSNIAWQNAKLNEQISYENYELTRQNLRKTIEQAYADAIGALNKYHAEQKAVASLKEAFGYTQSKFDVGMATSLDFNTAKTNMKNAESDLLQAKYNFVFKLKVLEFYEGKPLKL